MGKWVILWCVLGASWTAWSGDKVGNGGGLWACERNGRILKLHFVDLFEAEVEKGWPLKSYNGLSYQTVIEKVAIDARVSFPKYAGEWIRELRDIQEKARYVRGALEKIDDAIFRVRPKKSDCFGKKWDYEQLANFTKFNDIIVQIDLWEHPALSDRDRAGLYWHEAVYRWMRNKFSEKTSDRARQIVGLLFSSLGHAKKQKVLQELLENTVPEPDPPEEEGNWLCVIESRMENKVFSGYGNTKIRAEIKVKRACHKGSNDGFSCRSIVDCDKIAGKPPRSWHCTVDGHNDVYEGFGRIELEAEFRVKKACCQASREGREEHCGFARCDRD